MPTSVKYPTAVGTAIGSPAGYADWTNPTNIYTSNDSRAQGEVDTGVYTYLIYPSAYGFAIPSSATITSITANVEHYESAAGNDISLAEIYLTKSAGTAVGDNKGTATEIPTAETIQAYGTGLWGTTWTPTEINAAGFGLVMRYAGKDPYVYVDTVSISVTYRLTASILIF